MVPAFIHYPEPPSGCRLSFSTPFSSLYTFLASTISSCFVALNAVYNLRTLRFLSPTWTSLLNSSPINPCFLDIFTWIFTEVSSLACPNQSPDILASLPPRLFPISVDGFLPLTLAQNLKIHTKISFTPHVQLVRKSF